MKLQKLLFITALLISGLALTSAAADVKVIANPGISASSISADELKRIFLQTKASLEDGTHVQPVLAKQGAAHETFVKTYLGKTDAALQTYYRALVFTGKGSMPKTVDPDSETVAYVTKTKGAIGYISGTSDAAGAKTLEVK